MVILGSMVKESGRRIVFVWAGALCVLALGWVFFAYFVTPMVITKAYHQESLAVFNRMIAGRASHTLSEYLSDWRGLANKASLGLAVLEFLAVLAVAGANTTYRIAPGQPVPQTGISKPRLLIVYGLGVIIFGGTLSDILTDTEHWPFSSYPMYSSIDVSKTYSFSFLRLYGVLQRSPLVEMPLDDDIYLQPFDNSRLPLALEYAGMENRLDEAVADCLARYETARNAGRHGGPQLVGMRLYRVTWTLEPSASNVDRPDYKELLTEVPNGREGGT
jgi:hypothetical protein